MSSQSSSFEQVRARFEDAGQGHVFRFWTELDDEQRQMLLADLAEVDLERVVPLINPLVRNKPIARVPQSLAPANALPADPQPGEADRYRDARQRGEDAIRAGQAAAFTVAGGQGTRLGFDGPKGCFPISPVRSACLFQWFAEQLRATGERYGRPLRWYIMTSPLNHEATVSFFRENDHFGLDPQRVRFFQQGQVPAFYPDGRIALADKHRIALSPDGHGGSLTALARSGALQEMASDGVEVISYFQVDNPLVHVIDPLFIGLHLTTGSEMSSKAVHKAHDREKVGIFAEADGRLQVVEYSDLPDELATARNERGERKYDAGSIAIHVIQRSFVERLTKAGAAEQLPWHRAEKKVGVVDDNGEKIEPDKPNVVKLELFVFDAIPLARNPLVLYTRREEEFSPVKNASGDDCPETARRDMIRRAARWIEQGNVAVPRDRAGEPALPIEIAPTWALDAAAVVARMGDLPARLEPGKPLLLA